MSAFIKTLMVLATLLLIAGSARSDGIGGIGILGQNLFGGIGGTTQGSGGAAPIQGALMLEDGTSFLLLEDASSHVCLEGGC